MCINFSVEGDMSTGTENIMSLAKKVILDEVQLLDSHKEELLVRDFLEKEKENDEAESKKEVGIIPTLIAALNLIDSALAILDEDNQNHEYNPKESKKCAQRCCVKEILRET